MRLETIITIISFAIPLGIAITGGVTGKKWLHVFSHRSDMQLHKSGVLSSKKSFEQIFLKQKRYLDPHLSLVELAKDLHTNRYYLSTFINKTYGINFNRYVNACRLKEYDRLKSLPANEKATVKQLAEMVGFGGYHSYLRARKGYASLNDETSVQLRPEESHNELSPRFYTQLIYFSVMTAFPPIVGIFLTELSLTESVPLLVPILVLVVQIGILCYNPLTEGSVAVHSFEADTADAKEKEKEKEKEAEHLTIEQFEAYIYKEKPYLNPELKIADLASLLATNRTYLSQFINRTYGTNFSRYVNLLRFKELETLRQDPLNARYREAELIQRAGFSTYSGYRRFVKDICVSGADSRV